MTDMRAHEAAPAAIVLFFSWLGLLWTLPALAERYGWTPENDYGGAVFLAAIVSVVYWGLVGAVIVARVEEGKKS